MSIKVENVYTYKVENISVQCAWIHMAWLTREQNEGGRNSSSAPILQTTRERPPSVYAGGTNPLSAKLNLITHLPLLFIQTPHEWYLIAELQVTRYVVWEVFLRHHSLCLSLMVSPTFCLWDIFVELVWASLLGRDNFFLYLQVYSIRVIHFFKAFGKWLPAVAFH